MSPIATQSREQMLSALQEGQRFLLVTHENPDGDALGSLLAMEMILGALGKDVVTFIDADDLPLSYEYDWLDISGVVSEIPEDADQRVVVFLDCGNTERSPLVDQAAAPEQLLNIDHHHDNTRFGSIDYVVEEASSTAEIIWDLARGLEVPLTVEIAEAL